MATKQTACARPTRGKPEDAERPSLYDEVTGRIIAELEAGRRPWVQPWGNAGGAAPGLPRNALTARTYSGVNILILWGAVIAEGYPSQSWLTFKQAQAAGGRVRKGERGTGVVFADRFIPKGEAERAAREEDDARAIPFLKRFTVFNVAQCEGLRPDPAPLPDREIVPVAENVIAASGADFRIGGNRRAVEASLIENLARLDPDEVTPWENFVRLVKEGRKPDEIATTFELPDLAVKRILALGNLLPRIRDLYRAEKIDAATVRHLTMATSQQKAWLALFDDADAYIPTGHQLKAWLFGGAAISTKVALFDLENFGGGIVAELFVDERFFADANAFWTAQNAAIEAKRRISRRGLQRCRDRAALRELSILGA